MASETQKEQVCVVSTNLSFRKGVAQLLNKSKEIKAVYCECEINAIHNTVYESKSTIVIIEIHWPIIHEFDVIKALKEEFPELAILALTPQINELTMIELIISGAKGIVTNQIDLQELKKAITEIAESGYYFSSSIIKQLNTSQIQASVRLNKDEKVILKEIASGNIMIETCANGNFTVEQYDKLRASVLAKTNCNSNAGLAVFSIMTEQKSA